MSIRRARRRTALALLLAGSLLTLGAGAVWAAPAAAALTAHGSARQVYATGAPAGATAELLDRSGRQVAAKPADSLGGVVFYGVAPGSGYRVRVSGGRTAGPVTVYSERPAPWDPAVYRQSVAAGGYSYLTTRDGTQLAVNVWLPTSPAGKGLPQSAPPGAGPTPLSSSTPVMATPTRPDPRTASPSSPT